MRGLGQTTYSTRMFKVDQGYILDCTDIKAIEESKGVKAEEIIE